MTEKASSSCNNYMSPLKALLYILCNQTDVSAIRRKPTLEMGALGRIRVLGQEDTPWSSRLYRLICNVYFFLQGHNIQIIMKNKLHQ